MLKSELQHQFWVTKKTLQRKIGRKEEECILNSDSELDAKIELFKSIYESCNVLFRIVDQYQERLSILSQEEMGLGRFLKEAGKNSSTSNKVMTGAGKSISFCGQQRMLLRSPLLRLYHEVETFRERAISDTANTINHMERNRTEYRAALSWMKSASTQLDPDTGKGLEKFRKAQNHVKVAKVKFDKLTLDCMEKIDLLAAARCNMFSHVLIAYQSSIQQFATKTTEVYQSILNTLDNEPQYKFTVLKELTDTLDEAEESKTPNATDNDQLLFFQDEYKDECDAGDKETPAEQLTMPPIQPLVEVPTLLCSSKDENATSSEKAQEKKSEKLLNIDELMDDDFDEFMSSSSKSFMPSQLLLNPETSSFSLLDDDSTMQKQDNLLPITQEQSSPVAGAASNTYKTKNAILDLFGRTKAASNVKPSPVGGNKKTKPSKAGEKNKDMSAWFQLFADLDPLSNPSKLDEVEANNHDSHAA